MTSKVCKEMLNTTERHVWLLWHNYLTCVTRFLVIECSHRDPVRRYGIMKLPAV